MAECCTLTKRDLKQVKETNTHCELNTTGHFPVMKSTRFLKRIYNALRQGYYDYVLLLLIVSATWTQLLALLSMWD
jgi:hypothetical protein